MTTEQVIPHSPAKGTASAAAIAHCGGCGRFITMQAGGAHWIDSNGKTAHVLQVSDR